MGRMAKLASIGLIAAMATQSVAAAAPLEVFVSVPPQASIVREIGGPHVVVHCLVGAGQDPHGFEPTPKQVRALGRARAIFTIGMPFEQALLAKIRGQLPSLEVVDAFHGFTRQSGNPCGHDHAAPEPGHAHATSDTDPHVWLSPKGLKIMAKNTAVALGRLDPAHAAEFQRRMKQVNESIDKADVRARARLAPHRGQAVYVFHPAFGYFCSAYGLRQKAVEVDDKSPSSRQLHELIRQARQDKARVVFVQAQFDQHAAQAVADAIGGRLIAVDPLAEDVVANLGRIAEAIASGQESK